MNCLCWCQRFNRLPSVGVVNKTAWIKETNSARNLNPNSQLRTFQTWPSCFKPHALGRHYVDATLQEIQKRNNTMRFSKHLPIRNFSSNANHYEVLGVKQNATNKDIRSAFLKLSKECHPDMSSGPNNHEKFVRINEAYSVLIKSTSRRDYDLSLAKPKASTTVYSSQPPKPNSKKKDWWVIDHEYEDPKPFGMHRSASGQYYDKQFYSMRDKSKDAYYESKGNYYGVEGIKKGHFSNKQIVFGAMTWMLIGSAILFAAVWWRSNRTTRLLDARDDEIRKVLNDKRYFRQDQLTKIERYPEEIDNSVKSTTVLTMKAE